MTARCVAAAAVLAVTLFECPRLFAQDGVPCLTGTPPPTSRGAFTVEADVPYVFTINAAGVAAVGSRYAYLVVHRSPGSEEFVRLFESSSPARRLTAVFSFSQPARQSPRLERPTPATTYEVELRAANAFEWPLRDGTGTPLPACGRQAVEVRDTPPRDDFHDTRGQWWLGFRFPARAHAGGSVFVRRTGVAWTADLDVPRLFHEEGTPRELNPVTFTQEVRWRTSRGYFGAGVRYYPDEEPDRDRLRPIFVAGEELPSLKGLPIWMAIEIRVDERRWTGRFWEPLGFVFGFHFNMPGSRP